MSNAYEALQQHMTAKQIAYWCNDDEMAICVDFPGLVGSYRIFARVDSEDDQFHVFGGLHVSVPKGCLVSVAETIQLANYGSAAGDLELNEETNELHFHASESLSGGDLAGETVDRLIDTARSSLDCFLPAILAVIYGNERPEDAARQALACQRG